MQINYGRVNLTSGVNFARNFWIENSFIEELLFFSIYFSKLNIISDHKRNSCIIPFLHEYRLKGKTHLMTTWTSPILSPEVLAQDLLVFDHFLIIMFGIWVNWPHNSCY